MAASKSISAASTETSSVFTFASDTVAAWIQCKANNDGTPTSGDTVVFKLRESSGDPDADPDSVDEFSDIVHSTTIKTLDTNASNPAVSNLISIPIGKSFRVYIANNGASQVTVSCQMVQLGVTGVRTLSQVSI